MRIMGFDVASFKTGWAVLDYNESGPPTLVAQGLISYPAKWKSGRRLASFMEDIDKLLNTWAPHHVVVERPFVFRRTAVEALYKCHGVLKAAVYINKDRFSHLMNPEVTEIAPSKVRGILGVEAGKKGEGKKRLRLKVNEKFGLNLTEEEEDVSDAIGVAWSGYSLIRKKWRK